MTINNIVQSTHDNAIIGPTWWIQTPHVCCLVDFANLVLEQINVISLVSSDFGLVSSDFGLVSSQFDLVSSQFDWVSSQFDSVSSQADLVSSQNDSVSS